MAMPATNGSEAELELWLKRPVAAVELAAGVDDGAGSPFSGDFDIGFHVCQQPGDVDVANPV